MSLPELVDREPIQNRVINISAYRGKDGLWDVERRLIDTAAFDISNLNQNTTKAGTPIHDMLIRFTLDSYVRIVDIVVDMDAHPYPSCPDILPSFKELLHEKIERGWNHKLNDRYGSVEGCVHLVDLLRSVGTIGFKTVKREVANDVKKRVQPGERSISDKYLPRTFQQQSHC